MENVVPSLWQFFAAKGYQGRIVPIEHLQDLRRAIEERHAQGLFDKDFFQEELTAFSYTPPKELPNPRSLIVVAVPAPQFRVVFTWRGEQVPLILPPTYVRYRATTQKVEDELAALLGPYGYRVAGSVLPLKTLAVRSGLGLYGRNNISYVSGMGSFLQLIGCYTDLPSPPVEWTESRMLPRCEKCRACLKACPTGAISPDRFLLHAERCLTFHNERHRDFPEWIEPSWHNCLIGCILCQRICPENKAFVSHVEEGEHFTEEETGLLLQGPAMEQLPVTTATKVRNLGLTEGWDVLSRNLAAILERS
jgi:epoxyqueuosine reductase